MNLAVCLTAALVTTGLLLGGTATAASAVDLTVNSPERVVVNQSYEWVPWRVGGPRISAFEDAFVNLEHTPSRYSVDFDWADRTQRSGRFKVYDWDVRPGRHKVWLEHAVDRDYRRMTARPDYITVKFGSRTSLTTARDGRRVMLRSRATRWTSTWSRWSPYRATVVTFQRKTPSGWTFVGRDRPNRRGVAHVTTWRKAPVKYRAVSRGTSGVWPSHSAAKRR